MNNNSKQHNMHPIKQFLIELLTVRAGLYVNQSRTIQKK